MWKFSSMRNSLEREVILEPTATCYWVGVKFQHDLSTSSSSTLSFSLLHFIPWVYTVIISRTPNGVMMTPCSSAADTLNKSSFNTFLKLAPIAMSEQNLDELAPNPLFNMYSFRHKTYFIRDTKNWFPANLQYRILCLHRFIHK